MFFPLQRLFIQAASYVTGWSSYAGYCRNLWGWSDLGLVHLFINLWRKKLCVSQCLFEIESGCSILCLAAMFHDFPPGIGKLAQVRWVHTHRLDFKFCCFNCLLVNDQKPFQNKHSLHLSLFDYKTRSKTSKFWNKWQHFCAKYFFQWHCKNQRMKLSRLSRSTCPQGSTAPPGQAGPLPLQSQGLERLWMWEEGWHSCSP